MNQRLVFYKIINGLELLHLINILQTYLIRNENRYHFYYVIICLNTIDINRWRWPDVVARS